MHGRSTVYVTTRKLVEVDWAMLGSAPSLQDFGRSLCFGCKWWNWSGPALTFLFPLALVCCSKLQMCWPRDDVLSRARYPGFLSHLDRDVHSCGIASEIIQDTWIAHAQNEYSHLSVTSSSSAFRGWTSQSRTRSSTEESLVDFTSNPTFRLMSFGSHSTVNCRHVASPSLITALWHLFSDTATWPRRGTTVRWVRPLLRREWRSRSGVPSATWVSTPKLIESLL